MKSPAFLSLGPAALASAALLCGACAISAEGDIPDVEIARHDVAFPAAPASLAGIESTQVVEYRQKPTRLGLPKTAFSSVQVWSVAITAKSGVGDLAFIRTLRITARSTDSELASMPPVEIGRYERDEDSNVGAVIYIPCIPPPDVTALWVSSQVVFTFEATGRLPAVPWSADAAMRFGAKLAY
jgi:hypothetical protein